VITAWVWWLTECNCYASVIYCRQKLCDRDSCQYVMVAWSQLLSECDCYASVIITYLQQLDECDNYVNVMNHHNRCTVRTIGRSLLDRNVKIRIRPAHGPGLRCRSAGATSHLHNSIFSPSVNHFLCHATATMAGAGPLYSSSAVSMSV